MRFVFISSSSIIVATNPFLFVIKWRDMKTGFVITAALIIMSAASLGIFHNAMAKKTPYQAGYDHGCDDAKISNADDR
jgi:hypothetical protein